MSFAPIKAVIFASNAVKALIGTNPVRFYPFRKAPQPVVAPYAVWQQIPGGSPENYLGNLPDADSATTQIDVYASTDGAARTVALAIRDAVEPVAYVVSMREMGHDAATNLARVSMDVDWITPR